MAPLYQLLFWFIIKNVIPRGQGHNKADAMYQCFTDLMDRGEQINLPAIMIRHTARIANIIREHDLGYGFLLTLVFKQFRVELQKKVGVQLIDEIGSNTLMGCGFDLVKGEHPGSKQGPQPPIAPGPSGSSSRTSLEALQQEQHGLQSELTEVKGALAEEKELHARRDEDQLAILAALTAKLSPPAP